MVEMEEEYVCEYYPLENFDKKEFRQQLLEAMVVQEHRLYVVSPPEGEVCGFIWGDMRIEHGVTLGYVRDLQVKPEHRRKGYGRLLLEKLEEHFREKDIKVMQLHVLEANTPAKKLYGFQGYHTIKKRLEKKIM